MRSIIFPVFSIILLVSCGSDSTDDPPTIPAEQKEMNDPSGPLKGLGIRYDGFYREETQGVVYLIRFYPDGRAVLINGTTDISDQLPTYLDPSAKGDPAMGWYNVPVTVREDSIFFKTYPTRGEISYRGNVPSTSVVRLLRHSHINGQRAIKEYIFQPDAAPSK